MKPSPDQDDDALMTRAGAGDVFAYTALVQRHSAAVYRASYRMLGDRHEAEDVAQESFARLWQGAPGWQRSGGGVPAWLQRVAMNMCLDRLRRRGRIVTGDLPEVPDQAISAERLIQQGQVQHVLEASLQALSGTHRAAIVLTYYEGHPNKVAARILDLDLKAFESLLYRARQRLAAGLTARGVVARDAELLA